jgi:hypothetical protein
LFFYFQVIFIQLFLELLIFKSFSIIILLFLNFLNLSTN